MKKVQFFLLSICISLLLFSCMKDESQAGNSIEGTWKIITITSHYGDFTETSFNADTTINQTGQLGSIVFTENMADYKFTRIDTIYSGIENWELSYERVNEGFFKVPKFSLSIGNKFLFDVFFEDGTRNSERNAKIMSLSEIPVGKRNVLMGMQLEKE